MSITDHWYAFKDMVAERRLGAYGESLQYAAEAEAILGDTRKADIERNILVSGRPGETAISTTWEPSAELNAAMALSGNRQNAGASWTPPPEASNDGIHLLTKPLDMKAIMADVLNPNHVDPPAMREAMDALRKLHEENAKMKDAGEVWEQNRAKSKRGRSSTLRNAIKIGPSVVLEEGRQRDASGVGI